MSIIGAPPVPSGSSKITRTVKIAFFSSATITPKENWLEIYGIVVGAGEGGQGGYAERFVSNQLANGPGGRGGNGGGYGENTIPFEVGEAIPITVGLGGLGGEAAPKTRGANGSPGGAGQASSIGSHLTATGGSVTGPGACVGGVVYSEGGAGGASSPEPVIGGVNMYGQSGAGGGSAGSQFGNGFRGGTAALTSDTTTTYPGTGGGTGGPGFDGSTVSNGKPGGKSMLSGRVPPIVHPFDFHDPRLAYSDITEIVGIQSPPGWGGNDSKVAGSYGGGCGGKAGAYSKGGVGRDGGLGGGGGGGCGASNSNGEASNGGKGGDGFVMLEITIAG